MDRAESTRQRNRRETRRRILDCAVAQFSERGFERTSLRDLSQELGISIPTVRNHFGSKDGLLVGLLERFAVGVQESVGEIARRGVKDREETLALLLSLTHSVRALPRDLVANVMRVTATQPEAARIIGRIHESVASFVLYAQEEAGGRRDVETARLARLVSDLMLGALIDWVQSPDVGQRTAAEMVLRTIGSLVMPPGPGGASGHPADARLEAVPLPLSGGGKGTRSELPDRIYAVARRRFAQKGYRETSLDAIADELSISQLTIFYHFGSKDGLLARAASELADVIEEAVEHALASDKGADIRDGIAVIPRRVAALGPYGSAFTAEILRVTLMHPDGIAATRRIHGSMARLVKEGQRRGLVRTDKGPLLVARIVLDLCYGGILRWVQDPSRPAVEIAVDAMKSIRIYLTDGLAPKPEA